MRYRSPAWRSANLPNQYAHSNGADMVDVATSTGSEVARNQASLFWRFWSASTISTTGDAVTSVALPLVAVETVHASSLQISLITAARYAAWILIGLPAGVIVQRLPLRGAQVAMDLSRAAALASIPIAASLGGLHLAQLVAVAAIIGLASVIFDVGSSTFLPAIVDKKQLTSRNSLTSGSNAATQLGGPSLGGLLVQTVGAATSLLVDTASYLLSAGLLRTLPRVRQVIPSSQGASTTALIKDGWRYVVHHSVIRPCVASATLINFVGGGLLALTPVFLVRTLDAPAYLVGVLMATEGLGSLVGATLTTWLARRIGSARAVIYASMAGGALVLAIPSAGRGWGLMVFALGNAGFACAVVVASVLTRTHRQTVTPPDLLPRVMATVRFISWGAVPFGAIAAGVAAAEFGNRGALWLICPLALLSPLLFLSSPIRRQRELI